MVAAAIVLLMTPAVLDLLDADMNRMGCLPKYWEVEG